MTQPRRRRLLLWRRQAEWRDEEAPPRANLHMWSADRPEAIRHVMFRDWLREHPDDRVLYAGRGAPRPTPRMRLVKR